MTDKVHLYCDLPLLALATASPRIKQILEKAGVDPNGIFDLQRVVSILAMQVKHPNAEDGAPTLSRSYYNRKLVGFSYFLGELKFGIHRRSAGEQEWDVFISQSEDWTDDSELLAYAWRAGFQLYPGSTFHFEYGDRLAEAVIFANLAPSWAQQAKSDIIRLLVASG